MDDRNARLGKCFTAVFPDLAAEDLQAATPASVKGWDSIATLTLLTVICEEFNLEMDFADFPEDLSYPSIAKYVDQMNGASKRGDGRESHVEPAE
jgi:acyl carrier protein